jgi:hypothetical protein
LNFFNFDLFLSLTRFAFFLCLFVQELSEIHNPGDRGIGVRRDFYQIKSGFLGELQCVECG